MVKFQVGNPSVRLASTGMNPESNPTVLFTFNLRQGLREIISGHRGHEYVSGLLRKRTLGNSMVLLFAEHDISQEAV